MKSFPAFRFTLGLILTAAAWGCTSSGGGDDPPKAGAGGSSQGGGGSGGGGGRPAEGGSGGSAAGGASGGSAGAQAGSGGASAGAGGAMAGAGGQGGATDAAAPDAPPSNAAASKLIKLDTTAAGASVMGDVPKFPVAILLDETTFDFTKAKPKGEDIRFSTAEGAPLPHEIELWDATAKKAALWVKVDVTGNSTQMIKMTWGDPAAMDASDGKAVFDTKDGFMGVWHLSEPGSNEDGAYKDSTANEGHAKGVRMTPEGTGPGRVGNAILLDGSMNQWAEVAVEKSRMEGSAPNNMTYSIWFNAKSHTFEYQCMFAKGERDFRLHYFGKAEYYGNRHLTESCLESTAGNDVCPVNRGPTATDCKLGSWYHILAVHDYPRTRFYVNGKLDAELTNNGTWTADNQASVTIGTNPTSGQRNNRSFDGLLDEARLMLVTKDEHWIKLEYESQREGQKFSSFAAE